MDKIYYSAIDQFAAAFFLFILLNYGCKSDLKWTEDDRKRLLGEKDTINIAVNEIYQFFPAEDENQLSNQLKTYEIATSIFEAACLTITQAINETDAVGLSIFIISKGFNPCEPIRRLKKNRLDIYNIRGQLVKTSIQQNRN